MAQVLKRRVRGQFVHINQYCWWFRNPAITRWYGKYPIIYRVLYIQKLVGLGISEPINRYVDICAMHSQPTSIARIRRLHLLAWTQRRSDFSSSVCEGHFSRKDVFFFFVCFCLVLDDSQTLQFFWVFFCGLWSFCWRRGFIIWSASPMQWKHPIKRIFSGSRFGNDFWLISWFAPGYVGQGWVVLWKETKVQAPTEGQDSSCLKGKGVKLQTPKLQFLWHFHHHFLLKNCYRIGRALQKFRLDEKIPAPFISSLKLTWHSPQKKSENEGGSWKLTGQVPIWVFPKIEVPQNGWFIMETPIKMDDLGVPLFLETSIWKPQGFLVFFVFPAGC